MNDLLEPDAALQPYVEGYWQRRGIYDPPKKVRVLADACTKMIFELAPMPWPSSYLIGTQLSPIVVTLAGKVDRIGIRFRPGTASFFLGRPLQGFARALVPLDDMGAEDCGRLLSSLSEMESCKRNVLLDAWLRARLPSVEANGELRATMEVARLLRSGLPPPAVAARLRWPEHRLQRLCRRRFGASAVTLLRLFRFELLHRRLRGEPIELAALAADLGFSDQAHMAREFRHFGGTTISAFIRERAAVGNFQDAHAWLPVLRRVEEI